MSDSKHLILPLLILASTSPRRKALLKSLGISFETRSPKGRELECEGDKVRQCAMKNAELKAKSLTDSVNAQTVIIGSDTLVSIDGTALGKPANRDQARDHLRRLSGRTHEVVTGLALHSSQWGDRISCDSTAVTFHALSDAQIEAYTATKEPYDKAGGYATQGIASLFVKSVEGSHSNVIGFPVELFLKELESLTKIPPFAWVTQNDSI